LVFSPNGKVLASVQYPDHDVPRIRLWNVATGKNTVSITPTDNRGLQPHVAFSPDGKTVVSVDGGEVKLWDFVAKAKDSAGDGM
jgi:WD40 repeat protein